MPTATVSCGDMADAPFSVRLLWRQPCRLVPFLSCRRLLPVLCRVSQIPDLLTRMWRTPSPRPLASPELEALCPDAVSRGCRNKVAQAGRMKTTGTCFLAPVAA